MKKDGKSSRKEDRETGAELIIGFVLIIVIIVLWYFSWKWIDNNIIADVKDQSNISAAGAFGDKFGAINSLFSGLAFGGIIFTILLQRKELRLQREELEETRDVFKSQNSTLENQKFENTFFQMLNLFHSIVNSIDLKVASNVEKKGRDCFLYYVQEIQKQKAQLIRQNQIKSKPLQTLNINDYIDFYDKAYQKYKSDLSHYFRTLYHIVKFIDSSTIEDKRQYISIVRAQLSSYEQILLFYNCLHKNGIEKFKPLIEKYNLLKNIDLNLLFDLDHKNHYNSTAFIREEK